MDVSPMLISIKTIGLVVATSVVEEDMPDLLWIGQRGRAKLQPNHSLLGANVAGRHPLHTYRQHQTVHID
jgi:hypothetical protein